MKKRGAGGMAACQSPVPGAECRVEKCPSSAPPWRAPAHTEPPLSQYPLLLLGHFFLLTHLSCFSIMPSIAPCFSLPGENNSAPNRRRRLCQLNGMCCMLQITHTHALRSPTATPPLLSLSIRWMETQSFMCVVTV